MTFASAKTIEKNPVKIGKSTQINKNKGATSSSNNKEDLKMISIHLDFVEVIRDPNNKNDFLNFMPRNFAILLAKSSNKSDCVIEELEAKDDNT